MSKKTTVFGFSTKDLSTLNLDLVKSNNHVLPLPIQIKEIQITYDVDGFLNVDVELFNL
jgi:hypothetical protein